MSNDTRSRAISIIVPVLNEAESIRAFLRHLRERADGAEIIVVDGGSADGTRESARDLCDRVVFSARGRGVQMNAGARVARGDVLWFLHADTEVPRRCLDFVSDALGDDETAGGFFRIRLPEDRPIYRLTDSFAHFAGRLLRIRCGDHGFFCRRQVFEKIGGFPEIALMEDVEFFRCLRRVGRVQTITARLRPSARRYERVGATKLTLAYGLIALLYALGMPLALLAAIYQRACCASVAGSPRLSLQTWRSRISAESRSRAS